MLGEGVQDHGGREDLAEHGEVVGGADLARDEVGELLLASGEELGHLGEQSGALLRGVVGPGAGERGLGGGDGAVHVGVGRHRHGADDLLGGGGHDLEGLVASGLDPLAPDEELVVRKHGSPYVV